MWGRALELGKNYLRVLGLGGYRVYEAASVYTATASSSACLRGDGTLIRFNFLQGAEPEAFVLRNCL